METIASKFDITQTKNSRLSEVDFHNIQFGKIYADHMFMADFRNGKWSRGEILPFGDLSLSPATSVLHYGQAIFEGLKAYRSQNHDGEVLIFRPDENMKRLNRSAERICMPTVPESLAMDGLMELIKLDKDWVPNTPGCSLYIRPFLFATDHYIGLKPSETFKFLIFTSPVGNYYSEPVKVKIEKHYTRAAKGGTGYAKVAGNYAASMYPAQLAQQEGYHQLLWTDAKEHAYIEESGTMNVMFVIDGKLLTAPAEDTILPGITRKSVLTLAKEWGMPLEERYVSVKELVEAIEAGKLEDAFGTGTAATIAHIALIHHDGIDYKLPKVEDRYFSNKVLKELSDIQRGKKEDSHGWIFKV